MMYKGELAVQCTSLCVHRSSRYIVRDVSLRAKYGNVTAIVGPNGSGKTTLLKALAGILPSSGNLLLDERPLAQFSVAELASRRAYLPQHSALTADLCAREVVALARGLNRLGPGSSPADSAAIDMALGKLRIEHLAKRPFPRLSGGEQQLVLLARALASESRILLLDEPTSSLDIQASLRLHAAMKNLAREGHCVLAVLHDLDQVWSHADHAVLLDNGRLIASGTPTEETFAKSVEQTYGIELMPHTRLGARLTRGTS